MEIYKDDAIQYMVTQFQGGSLSLPKQDNMEDRESIVEKVKLAYPEQDILDLVGIVHKGDVKWQDIQRR
jgi:hypothetical protein